MISPILILCLFSLCQQTGGVERSFFYQTIWSVRPLSSLPPSLRLENCKTLTDKYFQTFRKANRQLRYKNITRTFFFWFFCFFSSKFLNVRIGFRNVSCLKWIHCHEKWRFTIDRYTINVSIYSTLNTIQLIFCWWTKPCLHIEIKQVTQVHNILVIVGDILTNKQKCNIAYLLALWVFSILDSAFNTISMWREEISWGMTCFLSNKSTREAHRWDDFV